MTDDQTHILIISLHADPIMPPGFGEYGGGHMYPKELLIGLSSKGYNISLLTRKSYPDLPLVERLNERCTIYRLDYGDYDHFDKRDLYKLHPLSLKMAMSILQKHEIKPSIIHSLYWNSGHLAIELGKVLGIDFVHSVISNGKQIVESKSKEIAKDRIHIESFVFQKAKYIICITKSEKLYLIKEYNINPLKIFVVGRPVHNSYVFPVHDDCGLSREKRNGNYVYRAALYSAKRNIDKKALWWNKKVFTYVGRINVNKGIEAIIQSWCTLYNNYGSLCPPLWMIGGTPEEIEDFHQSINISLDDFEKEGKIIWWGRLDAESISAIYLRTIAVIMHSRYEPGGRVSIEAMSSGIPVIATNRGFASDLIKDWENGFIIPFGDIKLLTKRMEHFIMQPYLSNSMGIYAKETVRRVLMTWNFIDTHLGIYNRTITPADEFAIDKQSDKNETRNLVKTYPVSSHKSKIDEIKDFLVKEGINFRNIVQETDQNHRYSWKIDTDKKIWRVKQPYAHLTLHPFFSTRIELPHVILADNIIQTEQFCSKILPTNNVAYEKNKNLILQYGISELQIGRENFDKLVDFLIKCFNYSTKINSNAIKVINELLAFGDIKKCQKVYNSLLQDTPWRSDQPFSSRMECKLLKQELSIESINEDYKYLLKYNSPYC